MMLLMAVQPLAQATEIQVYFWYGCPACSKLEETLEQQQLGADWQRIPAFVHRSWRQQAKWFATFRRMGLPWQEDVALMQAMTQGLIQPDQEQSLKDWMVSRGLNVEAFTELARSRAVNEEVKTLRSMAAGVRHVPAIRVGDTLIDASDFHTMPEFLAAVSLAMAEKSGAQAPRSHE
jgi:glutaredoxin